MTKNKFEEILKEVYPKKAMRSQIRNMTARPSWKALEKFKELGVPSEAFFNLNDWLEKQEAEKSQNTS
jgi:hypothetical protein